MKLLDGRLSLTTPEGVSLLVTPAGPVARAWAWAIDFILWMVMFWLLVWLLGGSKFGQGLLFIAMFVTYWGYPIVCEVYFGGRTIGKRLAGIEVLRADGLPVGWRESSLRNLLLVADFLPMMYAAGLLCMIFDHRFRRLGDLAAGTMVVYSEKPPQRLAAPVARPQPLPFALTPEQQRVLIDLAERERRLPPARLEELGTIAEPLTGLAGQASVERLRGFAAGLKQ